MMEDVHSWIGDPKWDLEEVPFSEWVTRAADQGMHPALVTFLQMFSASGGLVFPKMVQAGV
jgi:hypothetical protein